MFIDCDACTARGPACGDCVMRVLLRSVPAAPEQSGVDLDGAEQAAIAVLAGSGLVPPLRLVPAEETGCAHDGTGRPGAGHAPGHGRRAGRRQVG